MSLPGHAVGHAHGLVNHALKRDKLGKPCETLGKLALRYAGPQVYHALRVARESLNLGNI